MAESQWVKKYAEKRPNRPFSNEKSTNEISINFFSQEKKLPQNQSRYVQFAHYYVKPVDFLA